MENTAREDLVCANCQEPGKLACKGCLLVLYCGQECQRAHWDAHKTTCKSPLMKSTWKPNWVVEDRRPAFIGPDGPPIKSFGGNKYLWGNLPALDVLKLCDNEGEAYNQDLSLLFAASGDLRNVVKTVNAIPEGFTNSTSVVINDMDLDVVARNLITLLVFLSVENETQAVECITHLWYSAFLQPSHNDTLTTHIRPLLEDVVSKITNRPAEQLQAKTWTFGSRSLRVGLSKQNWVALLAFLDVPVGLSAERANKIRTNVVLAPERVDFKDRRLLFLPPPVRVCMDSFRRDGILLPYGQSRSEFSIPNPTFFQADWPMKDNSDPLNGWYLQDILKADSGLATNDAYGKLYFYVRREFVSFHRRIAKTEFRFQLFDASAKEISSRVGEDVKFDRIEVSNIADRLYLGTRQTIEVLSPLLREPSENPHATLLTLYMNAVGEMNHQSQDPEDLRAEMERAAPYLGAEEPTSISDPVMIKASCARTLVRDMDKFFDKYMQREGFKQVERDSHVTMKEPHTIIEKWPMRLKLRPEQEGAMDEFNKLLACGHTGDARYVEWKRTS